MCCHCNNGCGCLPLLFLLILFLLLELTAYQIHANAVLEVCGKYTRNGFRGLLSSDRLFSQFILREVETRYISWQFVQRSMLSPPPEG
jgi:hypothetical protein